MKTFKKAFSLIELLIVITIIGILAVAFLPSITTGPSRARDVQRVSDISDIALSLELYFQDTGSYPTQTTAGVFSAANKTVLAAYFDNGVFPSDPNGAHAFYPDYVYETDASPSNNYFIVAGVENAKVSNEHFAGGSTVSSFFSGMPAPVTPTTLNAPAIYVISK